MSRSRLLIVARLNPRARGSLAAGMSPARIATTIWVPADDLRTLRLKPGMTVTVRAVATPPSDVSQRSLGETVAVVAAAPLEVLAQQTVLMAVSEQSAQLLAASTEASGTPTFKGLRVELRRLPQTRGKQLPASTDGLASGGGKSHEHGRTVRDAVCTACGCICDDIHLTVGSQRITAAENACEIGTAWFLDAGTTSPGGDSSLPCCWIEGQPASIEEGIRRAATILQSARNPLIYGLGETTCETQRMAVEIADQLRANLDTTTSTFHGPTVMGLQAVGESTCTLGEIRDRADLVMLWGVNPLETDPRHYSRYSLLPAGRFVPRGREDRHCVVVDVRHTPTGDVADRVLRIKPSSDFEALTTLRALAQGLAVDEASVETSTGVALSAWRSLYDRMRAARYGVILYGTGITQTRGKHLNCEALLSLVSQMNRHTRFVCKAMRGAGNPTGGDNVLTWRTGYPFAVNFARGFPRYNPGEYTAADLLARREVDAALIVATDPAASFGPAALEHLESIPTVVVDWRPTSIFPRARVAFATSAYGLHVGGTVYRMDEIPLTLRPALDSCRPSDVEVLNRLLAELCGGSSQRRDEQNDEPVEGTNRP